MDVPITFTLTQLIGWILALCAGVSCVAAAYSWIAKGVRAAKGPDQKQNRRLKELEERVAQHDDYLAKDKHRLEEIEESNRVTHRALLALLAHGIDGNEVEAMKSAKAELQEYLIKR
jgi:hypothetical protein